MNGALPPFAATGPILCAARHRLTTRVRPFAAFDPMRAARRQAQWRIRQQCPIRRVIRESGHDPSKRKEKPMNFCDEIAAVMGREIKRRPTRATLSFAGKAGDLRTTSRCVPTSLLARLGWLAQFSETLAIAPSALGSAHRLTAKRRTPFSPRAHYKLSIWCWAPRYSRWPRPHELGELHDF